jgi:prepilin-type N-terminal cleavage/methylation domain-containing protein
MRLRSQQGMTLMEVMVAMTLALGVLAATLSVFTSAYRNSTNTNRRNDMAEMARNGLDKMDRQLRNLAQRPNNIRVINRMTSYDFVFQTSDPTRTWERYCLDTSAPASTSRGRLWEADSSGNTLSASMLGPGCPGTGWARTTIVADWVTNKFPATPRPVFTYACPPNAGSGCPSQAVDAGGELVDADRVLNVNANLYVDNNASAKPAELRVTSGVYLRNQNQAPVASWIMVPTGTTQKVIFNASDSSDYEGRTLRYFWFKGTMPTSVDCNNPKITNDTSTNPARQFMWGGLYIGEGVTLNYTFAEAKNTNVNIELVVCDPGARFNANGPRGVTVP